MNKVRQFIKRFKNGTLAIMFLLTQITASAVPLISIRSAFADAPANNGTLKVHEQGTTSGTESNDPKVCVFNFEGFDFDASQDGYIVITTQPGGVDTLTIPFGPADSDGYYETDYINDGVSGYNLADDQYKATLYGKDTGNPSNPDLTDEKAKSKVFKVICDEPETGSITIEKNAISDSDQVFHFTTDGLSTDATGFDLVDDTTPGLPQQVFDDLPVGTYVVSEEKTDGWDFDSVSCTRSADVEKNGSTVTINLAEGEDVICTFTNRETPQIDYCDPTQRPRGMSIAQWLASAQFDPAECFDYELTERCGYLVITVTEYPTAEGWGPYEAVYTTNGTVVYPANEFPASFDEDENGGAVNVTWYLVGPEKDYLVGTSLPNFWDETSEDVRVDTDCEDPDDASLTIVKDAQPDSEQDFSFNIEQVSTGRNADFLLDDDGDDTNVLPSSTTFTPVPSDRYVITETEEDGWTLEDIDCGDAPHLREDNKVTVFVAEEAQVTCTFTNVQDARVIVTKYNDLNRNGQRDEGEPTLEGWEMNLDCQQFNPRVEAIVVAPTDCNDDQQTTNSLGVANFNNVSPNEVYILSETLQEGWTWSNTDCDAEKAVLENDNEFALGVSAGDTFNCEVGNYRDVVLSLQKANDNPEADNGEFVNYTLTISVPEDSGVSFNTCVTDLAPEGFDYTGVWSASSTRAAHNTTIDSEVNAANVESDCGTPGGPDYQSPGQWFIGDVYPGEVVTLVYQTLIADEVTDGTYPDTAYANGCGLPVTTCDNEEIVYSNLHVTGDDPFVGTNVSLEGGQVLGVSTVRQLVDTGDSFSQIYMLIATILMAGGLIVARGQMFAKGGAK